MLTTEAFNALLKTLEEPPAHILFILATTDFHRVPQTIVSRCQTYNFLRPTVDDLSKYVLSVAQAEKIKLDTETAKLIAIAGDGSYRDALGALQKLSTAGDLSNDRIAQTLGMPKSAQVLGFCRSCVVGDKKAFEILQTCKDAGFQEKHFLDSLTSVARDVLLWRHDSSRTAIQNKYSEPDLSQIKEIAENKNFNSKFLLSLLEQYRLINLAASHPFLTLEIFATEKLSE